MRLNGDPVMFEQAALNLLNNALLHGGPTLTAISLTTKMLPGCLAIKVADDGKGIAPADFDRALGRFGQIEPSSGSGLGLPIAKAVVESFDGHIELDREQGWFTESLYFPVSQMGTGAKS